MPGNEGMLLLFSHLDIDIPVYVVLQHQSRVQLALDDVLEEIDVSKPGHGAAVMWLCGAFFPEILERVCQALGPAGLGRDRDGDAGELSGGEQALTAPGGALGQGQDPFKLVSTC